MVTQSTLLWKSIYGLIAQVVEDKDNIVGEKVDSIKEKGETTKFVEEKEEPTKDEIEDDIHQDTNVNFLDIDTPQGEKESQ